MNRKAMVSVIVLLLFSTSPGAQEAAEGSVPNPLAVEVQRVLGISPAGGDMLRALEHVIAVLPKADAGDIGTALDALVSQLLKGADPSALNSLTLSKMHVYDLFGYERDAERWKYGREQDRGQLVRLLWKKAQLMARSDPLRAAEYARASLLLGAHEDGWLGKAFIGWVCGKPEVFADVAGLRDAQRKDFLQFIDRLNTHNLELLKKSGAVLTANDSIITQTDGQLPRAKAELVIQRLREWHAAAVGDHGDEMAVIQEAWVLRNLAVARKNDAAVRAVDELMSNWKASSESRIVRRWVDEAMDRVAAPPKRARVIYVDPRALQR